MTGKKTFIKIILFGLVILVLGGFGGVLTEHLILPYASTLPILRDIGFLKPDAPVYITRREEIQIDDGINNSAVINTVKNNLVTVYFHTGSFGSQKFVSIALRTGLVATSDGMIAVPMGDLPSGVQATVILADGTLEGKIVAVDTVTGLGFVKISRNNFPTLKQNSALSLVPGENVIVIWTRDTPAGISASPGIVSARSVPATGFDLVYDFARINSSLPIEPAVSTSQLGAAIVDKDGALVGVVSVAGKDARIVRAEDFKLATDNILAGAGTITWPNLKMTYKILQASEAALWNLPGHYGALVATSGNTALHPDDFIIAVDGRDLNDENDFQSAVLAKKLGDKASLTVIRKGESQTIVINL